MTYDEFGVPEVAQTQAQRQVNFNNLFGFTGYQNDDIFGMYYAQARYYTPDAGRFMAEDPIKDQLNWYGYCNANPINFIDPTGLFNQNMFGDGVYEENGTGGNRTVITPGGNRAPSTPGPSGGNGSRNNDDCPARGRSHADMWYQICIENGLVAIDGITGEVVANLQPPQPRLNDWSVTPNFRGNDVEIFSRSQHYNDRLYINGVATNFTVREFASRCGADEIRICGVLIYYLQRIRDHFGEPITITSGYRSSAHNAATPGAASRSQHMEGTAADFIVNNRRMSEVREFVRDELGFGNLDGGWGGLGIADNFVHIDTRDTGPSRWTY